MNPVSDPRNYVLYEGFCVWHAASSNIIDSNLHLPKAFYTGDDSCELN